MHLLTLSWPDAILRVGLALIFGFCLGYERGRKNKPVDFRVFMIVAAATCLLAIMGEELMAEYAEAKGAPVELGLLRIVDGVLTGIGFLGAGSIIKREDEGRVQGTAAGASIWAAGSIGLMLGFGMYGLALLGFGMLAGTLVVFGLLRKPLFGETDEEPCEKDEPSHGLPVGSKGNNGGKP